MKPRTTFTPAKADEMIAKARRLLVIEQLIRESGSTTGASLEHRRLVLIEAHELLRHTEAKIRTAKVPASFFTKSEIKRARGILNTMSALARR